MNECDGHTKEEKNGTFGDQKRRDKALPRCALWGRSWVWALAIIRQELKWMSERM